MKAIQFLQKHYLLMISLTLVFIVNISSTILAADTTYCQSSAAVQEYFNNQMPARPALEDEQMMSTTHFLIHYTKNPPNSPCRTDWPDTIAAAAEKAWTTYSNLGWLMPPPDNGHGGDNKYDIYIHIAKTDSLHYAGGITYPDSSYTNPYTNGSSSWIEIMNANPFRDDNLSDLYTAS